MDKSISILKLVLHFNDRIVVRVFWIIFIKSFLCDSSSSIFDFLLFSILIIIIFLLIIIALVKWVGSSLSDRCRGGHVLLWLRDLNYLNRGSFRKSSVESTVS